MNEAESIAYIEEWDVTEAAKVLKWYEDDKLLRPCDCETIVAIETEELQAENAKLRELVRELLPCYQWSDCYGGCMAADGPLCPHPAKLTERARELGIEVDA